MMFRLLAGAGALVLAGLLLMLFGNAREKAGVMKERAAWEHARAESEAKKAKQERAGQQRVIDAVQAWADAKDALQPVILRSRDKVTIYAQTDAGRVMCLGRDRVQSIEADAAALGLDAAVTAPEPAVQASDAAR